MMTEWEQLISLLDIYDGHFEVKYYIQNDGCPLYDLELSNFSISDPSPTLTPIIPSLREYLTTLCKRGTENGIANIERVSLMKDKLNKWDKENKE